MRLRDEKTVALRKEDPERFKRSGVPNGMRKPAAKALWDEAERLADRFIQIMKDNGELPDVEIVSVDVVDDNGEVRKTTNVSVPTSDAGKAEKALREAFIMAVGPSTQNIKIQALNTVLAYTKSKPEAKTKLSLDPTSFLDEVAADMATKKSDSSD